MGAPVALAALAFTGSAISAQGQKRSGVAEQRAYESRAFNQEMQAADLETEALLQKTQTTFELDRLRGKINRTRGSQMAAVAASGVEFSGSARQVIERDAADQEFDALMLQFGGTSKEIGLKRSANLERANAKILREEGHSAKTRGKANASSTLLTGALEAGYKGYTANSVGGKD